MSDIFVSYTSYDCEWAHWIAKELCALGHTPHVHEWEIGKGDDILQWMEQRHGAADHVLCVVSEAYLRAPNRYGIARSRRRRSGRARDPPS